MLYLEDYLEMIENLPMEMRDKFTEMREMDLQVSNSTDSIEKKVSDFFKTCSSGGVKLDWKQDQMNKIKLEYSKALEDADEKVQLANQIYELVERHLRKLDQEVLKFKMELEADNAGITEVLEKKLSEPEHPIPQHNIYSRPEKRKYSAISAYNNNKHTTPTIHHNYPSNPNNNNHNYTLPVHNNTPSNNNISNNNNNNNGQHISHINRISSSSSLAAELSRDNTNNNINNNVPSFTRALNSNSTQQQHTQHHNNNIHQGNNNNLTYEHHHQPQPKIIGCNLGSGSNAAIAVAASRAIGATVEMQQGRRTSSLKASYEAYKKISKVLPIDKEISGSSSSSSTHLPHENKITIRANKRLVTLDKYAPSLKIKASLTTQNPNNNPNNNSTLLAHHQHHQHQQQQHLVSGSSGGIRSNYHHHHQGAIEQPGIIQAEGLGPAETELTASGWHAEPNEPRYCICNDVSYGDMVGCDNEDCPLEWFHYGCVGLQQAPRGKWYCPQCTSAMKRRGRK